MLNWAEPVPETFLESVTVTSTVLEPDLRFDHFCPAKPGLRLTVDNCSYI
jgi:hypothetical protein